MSKRDDELMIQSLSATWVQRSAPVAGTTAMASANAAFPTNQLSSGKFKHNVTSLSYSIKNTTAAAVTVSAQIIDSSIGGTVLADWDFIVAAGAAVQGTFPLANFSGLKGNDVVAAMTPPASSVVQKIAMAGWTDEMVNG